MMPALIAAALDALEHDPTLAARVRAVLGAASADEILTLDAAAELVAKTPRALRDAGRRGELEILRVGRSPRVRRASLLAWARPVAPVVRLAVAGETHTADNDALAAQIARGVR